VSFASRRGASPPLAPVSTHTHTVLSRCGRPDVTLPAIMDLAAARGFGLIAVTDHVHVPSYTDYPAHLARLGEYKAWRAAAVPAVPLVIGGEFEVLSPGRMVDEPALVAACECVLVATNHYQLPWIEPPPTALAAAAAHELDCIQTALDWPPTQVVAHPFFNGTTAHSTDALFAACDRRRLDELIDCAVERGVAFEIQPKFWGEPSAGALAELFDRLLARGGKVALGSDAHNLAGLDRWADDMAAVVARFGLRREDVWLPRPPAA
jgi:histidinol phosphatase-like PHP family hydrolase